MLLRYSTRGCSAVTGLDTSWHLSDAAANVLSSPLARGTGNSGDATASEICAIRSMIKGYRIFQRFEGIHNLCCRKVWHI